MCEVKAPQSLVDPGSLGANRYLKPSRFPLARFRELTNSARDYILFGLWRHFQPEKSVLVLPQLSLFPNVQCLGANGSIPTNSCFRRWWLQDTSSCIVYCDSSPVSLFSCPSIMRISPPVTGSLSCSSLRCSRSEKITGGKARRSRPQTTAYSGRMSMGTSPKGMGFQDIASGTLLLTMWLMDNVKI